jgi:SnoaL-like domain
MGRLPMFRLITSLTLALVAVSASPASAQSQSPAVPALSAQDYVEIRRTALYYNLGWDNSASVDGGDIVSRSFTRDSNFRRDGAAPWIGNNAVGDAAAKSRTGIHHWDSNLVIEPHPDGAKVFRYTLLVNVDPAGRPARVTGGGPLYEIFAKTPAGWLIKDRYHYSAGSGKAIDWPRFKGRPLSPHGNAQAASQTSARGESNGQVRPLSALDYVEIEMLYGWSNIALDSGAENGEMFARTFTPDGMFELEGRTISGSKSLAELAAKGEHGLRRWLSNLYVEPSAEGAVGWAYQLDVSIGKSAAQTTVREGGLYRDVLVKTPDGWRFKSRVYTPGNTMPTSVPLPRPR